MILKETFNDDFQVLSATAVKQSVTLPASYKKTIIQVIDSAKIRVAINGKPLNLSGTVGIIVTDTKDLILNDHFVNSIDFIRDSGESADVAFQIFGMWSQT